MIITYEGRTPRIGKNVFIAPTATVIGAVEIGDNASIWYGAVLRGDMDSITVGSGTNIQDNCTVHTDVGFPVVIGERVTVGHNAVVHGCRLGDGSLVGMGAVIQNGAVIGEQAVIAVGSVIRMHQQVPSRHLAAGIPAAVKKELAPEALASFDEAADHYLDIAPRHIRLFGEDGETGA